MVHGGQEFGWGPLVVAGDEIATTDDGQGHLRRAARWASTSFESVSTNQDGETVVRRHLDEHRPRGVSPMQRRRRDPELTVTPDKYLTVRYAGASGDFNPIHIDEEFAHAGRAARAGSCTACGRWPRSRGRRPRPPAGPHALKRLSVQFRGMGVPEQEITVTGHASRGRATASRSSHAVAEQDGNAIIRNAEAELQVE